MHQKHIVNSICIYIYIYLGSKRSFMHVLLKRMAHSLFIIFLRVFSYFLISFILLWSFCKVAIIVLKDATFRFAWIIFRLKNVNGNLNRSKIGIYSIIKRPNVKTSKCPIYLYIYTYNIDTKKRTKEYLRIDNGLHFDSQLPPFCGLVIRLVN